MRRETVRGSQLAMAWSCQVFGRRIAQTIALFLTCAPSVAFAQGSVAFPKETVGILSGFIERGSSYVRYNFGPFRGARLRPGQAMQAEPAVPEQTFLYFLFGGGGLIGIACTVPILCMSVASLAMLVEHLITLRRSVLMPHGLAEEVREHISSGAYPHAEQQCKLRPSLLAEVILSGLRSVRWGFAAVEKAMEDALQAQSSRILRKIELLSVIANISTMLGLFGTVVGLVLSFKKVADTQGVARASDLAGGIYLALMTTIEGLAIAIPSVAAYALFKHRADQLIADTALVAEYAFSDYKRERLGRVPTTASS